MEATKTELCLRIAAGPNEPRPKSITDLPPELVGPICLYLKIGDLVRVMRTCKYLYAVAYSRMSLVNYWEFQSLLTFADRNEHKMSSLGPITVSLRNKVLLDKTEEDPKARSKVSLGTLLEAVKRQLFQSANPQSLVPYIVDFDGEAVQGHDVYYAILNALRYYSHSRVGREYFMQNIEARTQPYVITRFFDLWKLKKLTLKFYISSWQVTEPWHEVEKFTVGKYYAFEESTTPMESEYRSIYAQSGYRKQYEKPLEQTLETALDLAKLFQRAKNLCTLSLYMKARFHHHYLPLTTLPPALKALSDAFMGLKKLESVRLRNFLFHPGFFLPIPNTVTRLSFHNVHAYPKAWWIQFAKCPLRGLNELIFRDYEDGWPEKPDSMLDMRYGNRWCDTDGRYRDPLEIENMGFELGDVQVEKLIYMVYEDSFEYFLPRDLIPCILAKNKAMKQKDMETLTRSYVQVMSTRCKLRWELAAAEQQREMEKELTKRLLEGDRHGVDIRNNAVEFSERITESLKQINLKGTRAEIATRGAGLEEKNIEGINAGGTNIEEQNIKRTNIKGTNIEGTNIEGMNTGGTNNGGTNIEGMNIEGTNTEGMSIKGTNTEGMSIKRTNIEGTNTNTEETKIEGTDVEGTNTGEKNTEETKPRDTSGERASLGVTTLAAPKGDNANSTSDER
ncbi:hypothetical protein TWF506_007868 [Arthrobotrys conoides]|uniref:F-box domain-containing protein n=1 Tax=Arthrobotrys conoides TaxID=74498 RepID=A0AAN8NQK4_9PEZI